MFQRHNRAKWSELGSCLIGLLLVLGYAGEVFAAGATCTTTGLNKYGQPPKKALICAGGCPVESGPPTACFIVATISQGGQPGGTCGCPNQIPPVCCYLVGIGEPPAMPVPPAKQDPFHPTGFAVGGTCPPCPLEGECVMSGKGTEAKPYQPKCKK